MKIFNYILSAIIFVLLALIIIAYASGYKIDLISRNISATSLIEIQTGAHDAEIYLNNKFVGNGRATIRNLGPGRYEIKIKRNDYKEWSKTINLSAGQAEIFNDIVLFKENPRVEKFDFGADKEKLFKLSDTSMLRSNGGEIYQNDILVTRISSNVKGICWYTDPRYIAFTADNKLKIVQFDGTNMINLADKDSESPVVFVNSGKSVIFENKGEIYRAEIR